MRFGTSTEKFDSKASWVVESFTKAHCPKKQLPKKLKKRIAASRLRVQISAVQAWPHTPAQVAAPLSVLSVPIITGVGRSDV
jgi:hypothetical protein